MPRKKRRSRLNRLRRIVRLAALNRVFRTNAELLSLGFLNYVHFLDLENECSQRTTNQRANYVQSTVFDRAFRIIALGDTHKPEPISPNLTPSDFDAVYRWPFFTRGFS